eukprot:GHVS01059252.1.p1 GENE.GHVS01059252.1~~GHVS01059252.1.p1  ORF type:complete len:500 (+),score=43.61 GHVS01059252.1:463-1962(+)
MKDATDAKVFRWSLYLQQFDLSRAAEDPEASPETWGYLLPPDPRERKEEELALPAEPRRITRVMIPDPPRLQDLQAAEADVPAEEKKWLVKAPEGTWHHSQTHRLWVPPAWREFVLHKYHAGRFGGHHGINRTRNKLKSSVWWLRLDKDVADYVGRCVACQRNTPPNTAYHRRSLQTPVALQTISRDFVGPRKVGLLQWWYAVLIDHSSRFVVTTAQSRPPTAQDVRGVLHQDWIPVFGAPDVLIKDRDPIFSEELRLWIREELGIRVGQVSPGYPQGNGLNETSHRTLEKTLAIQLQKGVQASFPTLLAEATMAYNAAPNATIGSSPFFRLFGMEPCLPGFQAFHQAGTEEQRQFRQDESRIACALRTAVEVQEALTLHPARNVKPGDYVVFHLSRYRQRQEKLTSGLYQYSCDWSLPHIVVKVDELKVLVRAAGQREGKVQQVPLRLVRVLKGVDEFGKGPTDDSLRMEVHIPLEREEGSPESPRKRRCPTDEEIVD